MPNTTPAPKPRRRRHGYRGYGSPLRERLGGTVHWGRGFSGVEFFDAESGVLPAASEVLPEALKPLSSRNE